MKSPKKAYIPLIGGAALLSGLYLKHLLEMKLTVNPQKAIYNGQKILRAGSNILAFTAHPDDLEFLMGGTLKILADMGHNVTIVDVTDGEKGTNVRNLGPIRIKEQRNASKVLRVNSLEFLHLPDLHLKDDKRLEPIFRNLLTDINPDTVFTFDYNYPIRIIKHPDHVTVGRVVSETVEKYLSDTNIIYYGSRCPNAIIDITDKIRDKKSAIRCHKSQIRFTPKIYDYGVNMFGRYNARNAFIKYGESFRMQDDINLFHTLH